MYGSTCIGINGSCVRVSGHVKVDEDNDLSIYINDIRVAYFASQDGGRLTTMSLTQREIDELELVGFAFCGDKRIQVRI